MTGPGLGITVDLDLDVVREIAGTAVRLGYGSLWVNTGDGEHADGLDVLRAVHEVAPGLTLGVGVIALHRLSSAEIVDRVRTSGLPLDRLRLGVGAGTVPIGQVRAALTEIRAALPGAHLVVAALGPAMCRLGGELADGVLLNWMPPDRLRWARGEIGPGPEVLAYVRVATGTDAGRRIAAEATRYRRAGEHYRRNADRAGSWSGGIELGAPSAGTEFAAYRHVLDQVILRALPRDGTAAEIEEIAIAGRAAFEEVR